MSQINDAITSVRESVSMVFRHILPGILIIIVSTLSKPSWSSQLRTDNTASIIILGSIAMVIGNAWYVFHRYFVLQVVDLVAYYFNFKGQPSRVGRSNYRSDLAKHVSKYFSSLPKSSAMGKHIRDRFSSFNFMYIVSEVLVFFTIISDDASFLREYYSPILIFGILGLVSATWQYSIVRVIDAEFVNPHPQNSDSLE